MSTTQGDMLALGRQVMATQTFSVHMGLELVSYEGHEVEMKLPLREEFLQHHGFVHGGVVSFVVDSALAYAGAGVLGPNMVTSNFRIDYVSPAQGVYLLARATVASSSKRQAVCRCEVYAVSEQGEQKLCALGQGTIVGLGERQKQSDG